jgi:hypothetical protein
MAEHATDRTVEVTRDDRVVASAHVTTSPEALDTAQATLHAEAGHLPVGSRASLVDAVLDLPEVQGCTHMTATVPLGDAESLQQLQAGTTDMRTRPAGSTAIVDAELPERHDTRDAERQDS